MRSWRPVDFEFSLARNLIHRCLVSKFSDELVSLDVDVLFAWGSFGRFHVTSEKLLSCFGSLLLQSLWIILALVCLEQLVRVGSCRNHHGSICASSEDSLVVHDVLREVLLLRCVTIGVLVFLLLRNHSWVCSEALAPRTTRLLHHFLNFI